ncbi:hypothetical protein KC19_10G116200 [Ceratodon purpureus]|uniref:Fe2OG dioxygenase domain-containing protein n=1 Tax=Ceratodon purpureus TaxID=3225 RepID=A0A8T0GLY5_CERPU|nr:hypothetical protein KC19_10G116200 [Ceratodon purpureus]
MMLHLQRGVDPSSSLCGVRSQRHGLRFCGDGMRGDVSRRNVVVMREGMRVCGRVHGGRGVPAMGVRASGGEVASCDQEGEIRSDCRGEASGIAVLDMGAYFGEEAGARERFVENLRDQCHTVGLFYVKNHGVSRELCDKMLATARQFFDLPTVVKNEMDYTASPQFRGYMKIGVENTAGLVDFREQIEFGPEENAEGNADGDGDNAIYPVFRRLSGPNQWPPATYVPEFRTTAMEFMEQMNVFSMHLMQALALSLGLDYDFFDSTFLHSPHYQMKVARYPPKPAEDVNAGVGVFGVGPHSDTGFLSLLLQDNVGGLQARTVDGAWIDVPPVEGTLVVNLGEMLQLATHGYYLATVHRVLSLPGSRSRYSIPFFFNPCLDAEAKPMDIETITSKEWRDTTARGGESTHGGKNKLHPVFGINTFKSFARSHPQIVKRHHPDLMDAQGNLVLDRILG